MTYLILRLFGLHRQIKMNEATRPQRDKSIKLSNPEEQALHILLMSSRSRYQFREQAHGLKNTIENRKNTPFWNLQEAESDARKWLELAESAENAGEMSPSHRFFMRVSAIESVNEARLLNGFYNEDLASIREQMDAIHQREGLDENEYWSIGEGPVDWEELNCQYSQVLDITFENTLREFGLNDIADLHHADRDKFDAIREEGRRQVFDNIPEQEKLRAILQQYETEASICAQNEAYHAASAMIGSAMETVLLLACVNHCDNAKKARKQLAKSKRPSSNNPKEWSFYHLVMILDKAGWLPDLIVGYEIVSSYKLIDMVRQLRNMLHPARHLSDSRVLDVERKYVNARATYVLLKQHLVEVWTS